jgi:hypothetical protein
LKSEDFNAEYVTEYAKDLVWEERYAQLSDQLFVTAQQNRRLGRLLGKVAVVVTDSPLLLGLNYAPPEYLGNTYAAMVHELHRGYSNLNIVLSRQTEYRPHGRVQTEAEALALDTAIRGMLDRNGYPYHVVPGRFGGLGQAMQLVRSALVAAR